MKIEIFDKHEEDHYTIYIKHLKITNEKKSKIFIDTDMLHMPAFSLRDDLRYKDIDPDRLEEVLDDEVARDLILFTITIANYEPDHINYGNSDEAWLKKWDEFIEIGLVEMKKPFKRTYKSSYLDPLKRMFFNHSMTDELLTCIVKNKVKLL